MEQQGNKFISPGGWFSMIYPNDWSEFEDGEGSFLFYNPEKWTGNFRISAYKPSGKEAGNMDYGREFVKLELKENSAASLVTVGRLECAYSKEMFLEEEAYYVTHTWIIGIRDVAFECSFTVPKGGDCTEAEAVIASLEARKEGEKYEAELIPVRLSEIFLINESYDFVASAVKDKLKKDFQGVEDDLENIQQIIKIGDIKQKQREVWLSFGMVVCTILCNEIEGFQWRTLIDGNREAPVLLHLESNVLIDPMKLVWSKVKNGEQPDVIEEYKQAMEQITK